MCVSVLNLSLSLRVTFHVGRSNAPLFMYTTSFILPSASLLAPLSLPLGVPPDLSLVLLLLLLLPSVMFRGQRMMCRAWKSNGIPRVAIKLLNAARQRPRLLFPSPKPLTCIDVAVVPKTKSKL